MTTAVAFDPLAEDYQQNPYGYYKTMREQAPVHHIESIGAWAIFRYDDVLNTFKQPELFSARDFIANAFGEFDPVPEVPSIIALDPPEHTRLRKLANKAFLPGVIRQMEPGIRDLISGLLDSVTERNGEFDFVSDFAAHVPVNVTAQILGVDPVVARNDFKRWTMDLLKAPSRTVLPAEELERMRQSVAELRAYFTDLIAYRRKNPSNDLVSALVQAEEDQQALTADEILSLTVLLQFGGAETPSHLISSALYECFRHSEALQAVKADPKAASAVIDETLRHMSPVHFVFQTATQDVELHGQTIPADAMVFSYISSANRDETVFEDPDRFDITRRSVNRHLSFAQGAHYCIGAPLGKMMCGLALSMALERMPSLRPVEDTVEWMPSFWVRGLARYPVRF